MMDAPQYSEPLLPSDCDYDAELASMMKRPDTSSDHEEYKTGPHQGSFNLHEVISTAVTVEESFNEEVEPYIYIPVPNSLHHHDDVGYVCSLEDRLQQLSKNDSLNI
eukprot:scaffold65812_cov49-Attheya_sp.AAC.1